MTIGKQLSDMLPAGPVLTSVDEAWNAVMRDVLAIAKNQRATMPGAGSFNFRGVDAVVDAVGPALRKHGVTVLPKKIKRIEREEYSSKSGSRMVNKQITVVWQVRGPGGDSFTGQSVGEAADAGDKSISKAQSVAYRVFLLQALCIPTGDRDPDYDVHERATDPSPEQLAAVEAANEARGVLLTETAQFGWNPDTLVAEYFKRNMENLLDATDVEKINAFRDALIREAETAHNQPAAPAADARITRAQSRRLHTLFGINKIVGRENYLQWCSEALGFEITTTDDLTTAEASRLIDKLEKLEKPQEKEISNDSTPDGE